MSDDDPPQPNISRLAEFLGEALEDELRVVSYFSEDEQVVEYMREDIRERYTPGEDEEILREMLLESIGRGRFQDLFGSELEATARIFEQQIVTVLSTAEREGVIVSLDREGEYSYRGVVDECQRILEG